MSNKSFSLAVLVFMSSSLMAQSLLKGKVTDQNGQPITGANVFILQNQVGTITQAEGSYEIQLPSNLKNVSVAFSVVGYRTKLQNLTLTEGDTTLDIALTESSIELQEVTITAGFAKEKNCFPILLLPL